MSLNSSSLEAHYRSYISLVNDRGRVVTDADLEPYVADELLFNGVAISRQMYASLFSGLIERSPKLHWNLQEMQVEISGKLKGDEEYRTLKAHLHLEDRSPGSATSSEWTIRKEDPVYHFNKDGQMYELSVTIDGKPPVLPSWIYTK
jgi:hypothetical protein